VLAETQVLNNNYSTIQSWTIRTFCHWYH